MRRPIRVLIVDDSAIVRKLLTESLNGSADIEVVGTAPDALVAKDRIGSLQPDVITLDIEMPRMDGLSFLRSLPADMSSAVIVVSSFGQSGCSAALQALEAGAVDVVAKPGGPYSVSDLRSILPGKIRAAFLSRRPCSVALKDVSSPARLDRPSRRKGPALPLIAIGASTGGTEAIRTILSDMPEASPPILIVQHIPPVFSKAFAERLNSSCKLSVSEAVDGDPVEPGRVLLAPGNLHMSLIRTGNRTGSGLKVSVSSGPRVCYQRPSVDVLFQSVAEMLGASAIGVILTGMGSDGARGLLRMKEAGARTIGQDENTCVVYGMPKEAIRAGAVQQVVPLGLVAQAICGASGV
jgi:two-component system, chemotaxis family, protein-glutamate methylesterase/glutaminase